LPWRPAWTAKARRPVKSRANWLSVAAFSRPIYCKAIAAGRKSIADLLQCRMGANRPVAQVVVGRNQR